MGCPFATRWKKPFLILELEHDDRASYLRGAARLFYGASVLQPLALLPGAMLSQREGCPRASHRIESITMNRHLIAPGAWRRSGIVTPPLHGDVLL